MGRLTKRIIKKFPNHTTEAIELNSEWGKMDIHANEEFYDIAEKLAHYEDMEEQGLLTIINNETFRRDESDRCTHRSCNNCDKYRREVQRYKDLEEQGRLIELPCAVGDTVWTYWIDDDRVGVERYKPANEPLCILVKDLWGIKFFATKEEAEEKMIAKLKELEGVSDGTM